MAGSVVADEWQVSDRADFRHGFDQNESISGAGSIFLKSVVPRPKEFGFISTTIAPAAYVGKRVRLSASVKTNLPEGASVQLWLRVDGDWKERAGCFDNMYKNRIKATTDWSRYAVEVDVPEGSKQIVYGVLLNGTGQVWIDQVELQELDVS